MRKAQRLPRAAALALALLPGCVPTGARFSPATGVLSVHGTADADTFVVSVKSSGAIVVNGGAIPIQGGTPTLANTVRIALHGRGGDDQLVVDPSASLPGARIVGGKGDDVLVGGAGPDEFLWAAGDGEDVVEGQGGADRQRFEGSDAAENVDVVASSGRVWVLRNVDGTTNDLNDVETIELAARGGSDGVVVGDLSGTDATEVRVDLAGGAGAGDGQTDTVTFVATNGPDAIGIAGEGTGVRVAGVQADLLVSSPEAALDRLVVQALGGDDDVDATAPGTEAIQLVVNGGLGVDEFTGGAGDELFTGGDGDDTALLGPGDDTAVWNPGDDDDTIEGEDDFDTLLFHGANVAETIHVAANGERASFTRSVASVVTDLAGVEAIDYRALGGADLVIVHDLSGTDVAVVDVALGQANGTGDGQPDSVLINGTPGDDVVQVVGDAGEIGVLGLTAQVNLSGPESALDSLNVFAGGGQDAIDASALAAPSLQLLADGEAGHDVLIGGDGGDVLIGGEGDDVLVGGPGLDVLDGGDGDNVLIQ
jgi:Ca2+-binding RTX toxin-like protein